MQKLTVQKKKAVKVHKGYMHMKLNHLVMNALDGYGTITLV